MESKTASDKFTKCPFDVSSEKISEFDMLDARARINPFPFYAWLQEDESRRIYKVPYEDNFYVVHGYEDVKEVLTDHRHFSNEVLTTKKSPFFALMDGDNHRRIRDVMTEVFNTDSPAFPLEELKNRIHTITQNLPINKPFELFRNWANIIPLSSLCIIYGVECNDQTISFLHKRAILINRALFALGGTGPRTGKNPNFIQKLKIAFSLLKNGSKLWQLKKRIGWSGLMEIRHMFIPKPTKDEVPRPNFNELPEALTALLDLMNEFADALFKDTKQSPAITILQEAVKKGDLTKSEAIMACTFIIFAGYETSASLLSNCIAHLSRNPDTLAKLKSGQISYDQFIEEALRFYTPVGRFLRKVKEDVSIGGHEIPKGAIVIVMLGAANMDEAKYELPFEFDEYRQKSAHLSFGKGIHFCIGASLARIQAEYALKYLLSLAESIQLDTSKELRMVTDRDNGILRYEELWVILDASI